MEDLSTAIEHVEMIVRNFSSPFQRSLEENSEDESDVENEIVPAHINSDLAWHEHETPEPAMNLGTTCIEPGEDSGWLNEDLDTGDNGSRDGGEL